MVNEGLGWDSLLKMVHNPGGHCYREGATPKVPLGGNFPYQDAKNVRHEAWFVTRRRGSKVDLFAPKLGGLNLGVEPKIGGFYPKMGG